MICKKPFKSDFGELLNRSLDNNEYLKEIYNNILFNYALYIFKLSEIPPRSINIDDALRFADLLSLDDRFGKHQTLGQEIVALLYEMYGNDYPQIQIYFGRILSNNTNFRGLQLNNQKSLSISQLDDLTIKFDMDNLRIPEKPEEYFFYSQKDIYNHFEQENLSYSAPTSMGKTYIMQVFIKQQIQHKKGGNFAIVVPTKALINEIKSLLIHELGTLLTDNDYGVVSTIANPQLLKTTNYVFVVTPERMHHLLESYPQIGIKYLFIDEAHKISSKGGRSAFYYKIIDEVTKERGNTRIIFASPNIPNPDIYLNLVPDDVGQISTAITTNYSPVSQLKYIVDFNSSRLRCFNDYSKEIINVAQLPKNLDLQKLINLVGYSKQNVVYCSSKVEAINSAKEYSRNIPYSSNLQLIELSNDIKKQVHSQYYLADMIRKGVAYHIGYLPTSIRLRIEEYYKAGLIRIVFCTSTLIEGVNLPADNLFITSYKNGSSNLTEVEFRNLIGRVGRIKYNLYGKVFLLTHEIDTYNKYRQLLSDDIPNQKLSICSQLTKHQKEYIIECLENGDIKLGQASVKYTKEEFSLMRKISLMLVDSIIKNRKTIIYKEFLDVMNPKSVAAIRKNFFKVNNMNDINVSFDQKQNLLDAIRFDGLKYPDFSRNGGKNFYDEVYKFMVKLAKIFRWDIYERHTLGHLNKNGEYSLLKWYTTLLLQWMSGAGLSQILASGLKYKASHADLGVWVGNHKVAEVYNGSIEHMNYEIADTLSVIDTVILFSVSNYFREFSDTYKKVHCIHEDNMDNDWFDFVEYGTPNTTMKELQCMGYSRETALLINERRYKCVKKVEGKLKLVKSEILKIRDMGVVAETEDISINYPELFI